MMFMAKCSLSCTGLSPPSPSSGLTKTSPTTTYSSSKYIHGCFSDTAGLQWTQTKSVTPYLSLWVSFPGSEEISWPWKGVELGLRRCQRVRSSSGVQLDFGTIKGLAGTLIHKFVSCFQGFLPCFRDHALAPLPPAAAMECALLAVVFPEYLSSLGTSSTVLFPHPPLWNTSRGI
ncbi:hypothetical protein F5146DRAFT_705351 [Armillaria mellea]|nr:hypothetical protein F5146DRAFT_705351 [Armillaria mellea]